MAVDRRGLVQGMAAAVLAPPSLGRAAETPNPAHVIEARKGTSTLAGHAGVEIWGYDGMVPGPVLRLRKGEPLRVRLVNKLEQPTTICWHGVRGPNAMDGVAGLTQAPVAPGTSFDISFTPPDSGLFWFCPHVGRDSIEQMARGLAGVLLVEEADPPKVDDDRLVVLADWTLDAKNAATVSGSGRKDALTTVNGLALPLLTTARPGARWRLRLLNASSVSIVQVAFEGIAPTIVAIDGQPSEIFQPMRSMLPIGPGARFEVMVDLPREAGKTAKLRLQRETGAYDLMVIVTKGEPVAAYPPIAKLPDNPALPGRIHLERALKRDLAIEKTGPQSWSLGSLVKGAKLDAHGPLFMVRRGEPVSLALINRTDEPQQMGVHGHAFRVLHDLDDGWDPYWRDTILIAPRKTKHIAFVADNPGKWAIESLMMERQVAGLFGWFEVG